MEDRLLQLAKHREPAPDDGAARQATIERLRRLLPGIFGPQWQLQLVPYGSFLSSCYSRGSDLDLALTGSVRVEEVPYGELSDEALQRGGAVELEALTATDWVMLLRRLADTLEAHGVARGPVTRILEARVPIIKFVEAQSGIECDVCVTTRGCDFKGSVMRLLHELQPALAPLIRLVKLWAKQHDINNAHCCTLNSWSLALCCLFSLQTYPGGTLLPPLWRCFHDEEPSGPGGAGRPLQDKSLRLDAMLAVIATKVSGGAAELLPAHAEGERPGLLQLLLWFLSCFTSITGQWRDNPANRNWRVSPWLGRGYVARFPRAYVAAVEEPFDSNDNTARSVGIKERNENTLPYIAWVFGHSVHLLRNAATERDAARTLAWLFGPEALPCIGVSALQIPSSIPLDQLKKLERIAAAVKRVSATSAADGGEEEDLVSVMRAVIDATRVGSPILSLEEWRAHHAVSRSRPPHGWHRLVRPQPAPPPQVSRPQAMPAPQAQPWGERDGRQERWPQFLSPDEALRSLPASMGPSLAQLLQQQQQQPGMPLGGAGSPLNNGLGPQHQSLPHNGYRSGRQSLEQVLHGPGMPGHGDWHHPQPQPHQQQPMAPPGVGAGGLPPGAHGSGLGGALDGAAAGQKLLSLLSRGSGAALPQRHEQQPFFAQPQGQGQLQQQADSLWHSMLPPNGIAQHMGPPPMQPWQPQAPQQQPERFQQQQQPERFQQQQQPDLLAALRSSSAQNQKLQDLEEDAEDIFRLLGLSLRADDGLEPASAGGGGMQPAATHAGGAAHKLGPHPGLAPHQAQATDWRVVGGGPGLSAQQARPFLGNGENLYPGRAAAGSEGWLAPPQPPGLQGAHTAQQVQSEGQGGQQRPFEFDLGPRPFFQPEHHQAQHHTGQPFPPPPWQAQAGPIGSSSGGERGAGGGARPPPGFGPQATPTSWQPAGGHLPPGLDMGHGLGLGRLGSEPAAAPAQYQAPFQSGAPAHLQGLPGLSVQLSSPADVPAAQAHFFKPAVGAAAYR